MDLEKIATVLEATALYIDSIDAAKKAATLKNRDAFIETIRDKYATSTGTPISNEVIAALQNASPEILGAIEKLAPAIEKNAELGSPADNINWNDAPRSTKEAIAVAEQEFLDFILD